MFSLLFLVLSYVEWQIPGFVSFVFPLYIVLGLAILTGVGALVASQRASSWHRRTDVLAIAIGLLFSILVFHAAEVFGAYRLLLAMVALILPVLLLKALSDVNA